MKRAVLFDFDGTLADTMGGHFNAWCSVLEPYGVKVQAADFYALEGTLLHEIARSLTLELALTNDEIAKIVRQKKECYVAAQSAKFYPGVEEIIGDLKKNRIPMAIVTAGHLDQLLHSVPERFLKNFDVLITGDRVLNGKPHPEPYLTGASALGLAASDCIAVENAPLGVQSAMSAGSFCVAVASTVHRDKLSSANEVIDCFELLRNSQAMRELLLNS